MYSLVYVIDRPQGRSQSCKVSVPHSDSAVHVTPWRTRRLPTLRVLSHPTDAKAVARRVGRRRRRSPRSFPLRRSRVSECACACVHTCACANVCVRCAFPLTGMVALRFGRNAAGCASHLVHPSPCLPRSAMATQQLLPVCVSRARRCVCCWLNGLSLPHLPSGLRARSTHHHHHQRLCMPTWTSAHMRRGVRSCLEVCAKARDGIAMVDTARGRL
jgi:hypothetical protein